MSSGMRSGFLSPLIAAGAVAAGIAVGVASWAVNPGQSLAAELMLIVFVPAYWVTFEYMAAFHNASRRDVERERGGRLLVVVMALVGTLDAGPELLMRQGLLSVDWLPVIRRVAGVLLGAAVIVVSNRIPKFLPPRPSSPDRNEWQGLIGFVGRMGVLIGALTIGVWLAFPVPVARILVPWLFALSTLLIVGRRWWARSRRAPGATG